MKNLFLGISLSVASALIPSQASAPPQQNTKSRPDPVVAIKVQPDSPLTITTRTHWFDEKIFEIYVVVKNVGDKRITAYATTSLNLSAPNSEKACFIHRFPGPGKMLTPDKGDGRANGTGQTTTTNFPSSNLPLILSSSLMAAHGARTFARRKSIWTDFDPD